MLRTVIIIILILLGIFIHPFSPGTLDFIYRFIIFAIITYLVYSSTRLQTDDDSLPNEKEDSIYEFHAKLEFEYEEKWNIGDLIESDEKTGAYIKNQFDILASILYPENGWIFYKKYESKLNTFFNKTFSGNPLEIKNHEFELMGLMQILSEKDEILIENNLSKVGKLINFYDGLDYTPSSFIGIPITIYENQKILIVYDSHAKEHFNREDQSLIEKVGENIQSFVLNRVKAYSLLKSLNENEKLLDFAIDLNKSRTISMATDRLADRISLDFEASRLTISIVKQESNLGVIKKVIGQIDDFNENTEFPLDEGITGWVISKNKPYIIDDLEKGEYFIPRYTKNEKNNFGLRSFLGIPIEVDGNVFGAITLEHLVPDKYNESEKTRLQKFIKIFQSTYLRQRH